MNQAAHDLLQQARTRGPRGASRLLIGGGLVACAAVVLLTCAGLSGGTARAAGDRIWYLEFNHETPQWMTVGDEGHERTYWYLPYTLTNVDGEAHPFFLDIRARDDHGVEYQDGYFPDVVDELERRIGEGVEIELFSQPEVTTPKKPTATPKAPFDLGHTADINLPAIPAHETWRCVAVFPAWDPRMDRIDIYVKGLTNDVQISTRGANRRVMTEPLLKLEYERPGDEFFTDLDMIYFVSKSWLPPEGDEREWEYQPTDYERSLYQTEYRTDLR